MLLEVQGSREPLVSLEEPVWLVSLEIRVSLVQEVLSERQAHREGLAAQELPGPRVS